MGARTTGAIGTAGATEEIGFGLVVFERSGDRVDVTVRGITANLDPDLVVFEGARRAHITTVASPAQGRTLEYSLRVSVDAGPGTRIVVEGRHCGEALTETIAASELPDGLPVVCTADPASAGLPARFLHRRGDRYVLMTQDQVAASRPGHRVTMVA